MLQNTSSKTISSFFVNDFIRVSSVTAKKVCDEAGFKSTDSPHSLNRDQAEKIYKVLQKTKIIAPPTNCLSPIGSQALQASLEKEIPAEFFASVTRPASVYRGNPFQIEA